MKMVVVGRWCSRKKFTLEQAMKARRCWIGVGGQRHALTALPPGKTRHPLYRRLGGPHGRSVNVRENTPLPVFDPGLSSP